MSMVVLGLNTVVPLFVIMGIGYIVKLFGIINDKGIAAINRLLFWVFLPAILFVSVYETNLKEVFDFKIILYSMIGTTLIFLISFALVPKLVSKRNKCGVIIQALIRGNEVYYGFPVVVSLIGHEYLGLMSIVVAFAVIAYNAYSVIALEYFKGDRVNLPRMFKNLFTNPLIIATIVSALLVLGNMGINPMIMRGLSSIADVASPLALFLLGASFTFSSSRKYIKDIFWVALFKLIIIPAIVLFSTYAMGFSNPGIVILFVTFGVPTAVSSYSMAMELKADHELAGQIVVFTSLISIGTVFLFTIVMQLLGII